MRKVLLTVAIGLLLALCAYGQPEAAYGQPEAVKVDPEILAMYEYDRSLRLDAQEDEPVISDGRSEQRVTFMSANDERVTALVVKPLNATKPCPVVIYQHGVGSNKGRAARSPVALEGVKKGWATVGIDAYNHGERKLPEGVEVKHLKLYVQTTIDHRRLIDYLETREDLDASRIAYVGVSMGAMMGSATCGIDKRVGAAIFIVGGGGWTLEQFMRNRGGMEALTPELEAEFEQRKRTDPAVFVGMISPRPLLMVNGTLDKAIPRANAEALFAAAREPKRHIWKELGHGGAAMALTEEMEFLTKFFEAKRAR